MALARKRLLLAKIESTYGTDPTPDEGTDVITTIGLTRTPYAGNTVERNLDLPKLGAENSINTGPMVEVSFEVELAASGTAGTAPHFGPLLRACGYSETLVAVTSATYAPVSESFESVTLYFNLDGEEQQIHGARGNVSLNMSREGIPRLAFRFIGLYEKPTAVAMYDPTFNHADPFPVNNANTTTATVHGTAVNLSRFSYDSQNDVVHRNLPGSDTVEITDRNAGGSVLFEKPLLATKDFFAAVESHDGSITQAAISIVHGSGAGSVATISVPRAQLVSMSENDEDKIVMFDCSYKAIPSDSGNDEFSLAFT